MFNIRLEIFILFAIMCLLGALLLPTPDFSKNTNTLEYKASELITLNHLWHEQKAKYLSYVPMQSFKFNLKSVLLPILIGIGIILSVDIFVRRKTESVIERFRKKNKNSR